MDSVKENLATDSDLEKAYQQLGPASDESGEDSSE